MRLNTNPPSWKIIFAVILILLTDLLDALLRLGRLPETPYEISIIVIHALILAFMFLERETPGENKVE